MDNETCRGYLEPDDLDLAEAALELMPDLPILVYGAKLARDRL